jgi:hypothetical protein
MLIHVHNNDRIFPGTNTTQKKSRIFSLFSETGEAKFRKYLGSSIFAVNRLQVNVYQAVIIAK